MDEEELVRLVARGDRSAFDELYRRTSPWLAVRLRRRRADDELGAEDEVLGATIGDEVGEAVRRLAPELRQVSGNGRDVRAALESAPDIRWDLLLGAGTPACANAAAPGTAGRRRYDIARFAAAARLLDQEPPAPADPRDPGLLQQSETLPVYQALRELPPAEQRTRVAELREAELACDGRDRWTS